MATAIPIDGDFFLRRYRFLVGNRTARQVATHLHRMCLDHLKQSSAERDLYRVFFYDSPTVQSH